MCVCSRSSNGPLFRAVAATLRRLRFRLASWGGPRTHCGCYDAFNIYPGPHLPRCLGQPHGLQVFERGASRHRRLRHGAISADRPESKPALDNLDGISAGSCGAFAFPEIYQPGYESIRLRRVFEGSLIFADSVAVRWDRTTSQTEAAHRQLSLLADLLAPAIGTQATSSAKGLLEEFGSISGVAAAPSDAIERALGGNAILAAMLAAGRAIVHIGMRENVRSQRVNCNDPALHNYLLAHFSGMKNEHLFVLFLDARHGLIAEERYTSGSAGFLSLRPRKLFSRALALSAHAIVLAHNHPSGDPNPSQDDIDATRRIAADANFLDIQLLDHLIIGHNQVTSMLRSGLL